MILEMIHTMLEDGVSRNANLAYDLLQLNGFDLETHASLNNIAMILNRMVKELEIGSDPAAIKEKIEKSKCKPARISKGEYKIEMNKESVFQEYIWGLSMKA